MGQAQPPSPREKPAGMWLEGPRKKGASGNMVWNCCIYTGSGKEARRWESWQRVVLDGQQEPEQSRPHCPGRPSTVDWTKRRWVEG